MTSIVKADSLVNPEIEYASTLSSRYYIDPEFLAREQCEIFWRTWQIVGRSEQLKNAGDFITANLLGEPLLISRGGDGTLRGFYNVCRHRAGPVAEGCGSRKVFRCGYHGWTYGLDGKLMNAPEMEGTKDFCAEELRLRPVQVGEWEGQVFVNLDADAEPLLAALRELPAQAAKFKFGEMRLAGLSFALTAGTRLGIVGPNGSGKSTLMRLMQREILPDTGEVRLAPNLRIVYFDQTRRMDEAVSLRRALAPDSDSVIYQDSVIHVASWAERFLFTSDQLNQPVERLSGGERARVLIAKLMLQPADLLLLDEPTNDLDIPTLEILEESLLEYKGALVLITHDRFMLDRVSTVVLGLDGAGRAEQFADYSQWENWQNEQSRAPATPQKSDIPNAVLNSPPAGKKKLSYLEAREYATLEEQIATAESLLAQKQRASEDPAIATDATRLQQALAEANQAAEQVDSLYRRWHELEEKLSG